MSFSQVVSPEQRANPDNWEIKKSTVTYPETGDTKDVWVVSVSSNFVDSFTTEIDATERVARLVAVAKRSLPPTK